MHQLTVRFMSNNQRVLWSGEMMVKNWCGSWKNLFMGWNKVVGIGTICYMEIWWTKAFHSRWLIHVSTRDMELMRWQLWLFGLMILSSHPVMPQHSETVTKSAIRYAWPGWTVVVPGDPVHLRWWFHQDWSNEICWENPVKIWHEWL